MTRLRQSFLATLALTAAALVPSVGTAAPPVEAFGNLPTLSNVHLSPDGKHMSAIQPINGRPYILVFDVDPKPDSKPVGFNEPDGTPIDTYWANDDRLICLYYAVVNQVTTTRMFLRANARAISVSLSGKPAAILTRAKGSLNGNWNKTVVTGRDLDGQHVYLVMWGARGSKIELDVIRADIEDEQADIVEYGVADDLGFMGTIGWALSKGKAVARLDSVIDKSDTELDPVQHVFLRNGTGWREAGTFGTIGPDALDVYGATADESALVVGHLDDKGMTAAYAFPMNGSALGPVLFSNPQYDVDSAITDEWTGSVIGVHYITDQLETQYFDPAMQKIQRGIEAALPGQSVAIVSIDANRENMIARAEDPRHPAVYWLYNSKTHQMHAMAAEYPSLQASDLGEMKPYPYKSRDGLDIHAYLTLPPGKTPKKLPTVIFPHGGPGYRDRLDFDWWAQFMASRGYAVLQPNFRGSTGYGGKFFAAGNRQWGKAMQNDITDGVQKLIADGIADPKRICIVGASYGGYAALAGATFTPDLYACAVSVAGVSNIPHLSSDDGNWGEIRHSLGDIFKDEAAMEAVSPALHADQVKAPILLIHCDRDITVPIAHSQIEYKNLLKAHKDVQFITIADDDHYLTHGTTRVRVLTEIEKFLKDHIGN